MEAGEVIRKRRKELGLTLEQVANQVGVGKSTVRKWETGLIKNMRRDKISALSKVLGVSPIQLMGLDELKKEIQLNFSANLKKYMIEKNLNVKQVASIVDKNADDIISWLNMDTVPSVGEVQKLADYFGVSAEVFDTDVNLHYIELLPEEEEIIKLYRSMSQGNKTAVLNLIKNLSHDI